MSGRRRRSGRDSFRAVFLALCFAALVDPRIALAEAGQHFIADGAEVIVAGKRCPVAGRISMDLMAIDITDLPDKTARRGHMVTLIGEGITVDEVAHHFGTIGYEVLTSLGKRYARIYKGGEAKSARQDADNSAAAAAAPPA